MRVTSKDLSSESKVIIYPGSRKFFANELPILREKLDSFCDDFKGVNLCCEIEYDRFLIFMISEETAFWILTIKIYLLTLS